jgi:hypothetical protein
VTEGTYLVLSKIPNMSPIAPREVFEAEDLLEEVQSWSQEELDALPNLYREKAKRYRQLGNRGDG